MTLTSSQTTITGAASAVVIVAATSTGYREVLIANAGANTIYLGPSGVTNTTGLPVPANTNINLNVPSDVAIYAYAATTSTAAVLEIS